MKKHSDKKFSTKKESGRMADRITVLLSLFCILVLMILLPALPKKDFSENENRYLSAFPQLTLSSIKDGSFMENMETYLSDHFPMRDFWIGLRSETERALGKAEISDVLLAEDGYLIEKYREPSGTERIITSFQRFEKNMESKRPDCSVQVMLVPTAITIYEDRLPAGAVEYHQMDTISEILSQTSLPSVDVYQTLYEHRDDGQLFYRTDHHWTTLGAYYAYQEYCRAAGFEPQPLEDMDAQVVTDSFQGTYYSKVNLWSAAKDSITIYTNPADKLTVNYQDTEETTDSLYNLDYVKEKDKYSLFLDNLHSLVEITNETAETNRQLLLVKDSYANSMVPFLVRHFSKIYVVDTRYYKSGPSGLAEEYPEITDVLILYNLSTMDTDTGIKGIF